ncbi:MAG: hypothetical protein WED09_07185 [Homoserinimonas sp.]
MIERSESVVERRTVNFAATDPAAVGLTAAIADGGELVTITCSTIEGQSSLRVSSGMLAALSQLVTAVAVDGALVIPPPPEPEPDPDDPTEPTDAP